MSRRHGPIQPLSSADYAAGIRMEGDKLIFPAPPPLSDLHRNVKGNFCPFCKKHFNDGCQCLIEPTMLDNKPAQGRPWGYKGAMVLPIHDPDHPKHPRRLCLAAVPHAIRIPLDIYT